MIYMRLKLLLHLLNVQGMLNEYILENVIVIKIIFTE